MKHRYLNLAAFMFVAFILSMPSVSAQATK